MNIKPIAVGLVFGVGIAVIAIINLISRKTDRRE